MPLATSAFKLAEDTGINTDTIGTPAAAGSSAAPSPETAPQTSDTLQPGGPQDAPSQLRLVRPAAPVTAEEPAAETAPPPSTTGTILRFDPHARTQESPIEETAPPALSEAAEDAAEQLPAVPPQELAAVTRVMDGIRQRLDRLQADVSGDVRPVKEGLAEAKAQIGGLAKELQALQERQKVLLEELAKLRTTLPELPGPEMIAAAVDERLERPETVTRLRAVALDALRSPEGRTIQHEGLAEALGQMTVTFGLAGPAADEGSAPQDLAAAM